MQRKSYGWFILLVFFCFQKIVLKEISPLPCAMHDNLGTDIQKLCVYLCVCFFYSFLLRYTVLKGTQYKKVYSTNIIFLIIQTHEMLIKKYVWGTWSMCLMHHIIVFTTYCVKYDWSYFKLNVDNKKGLSQNVFYCVKPLLLEYVIGLQKSQLK